MIFGLSRMVTCVFRLYIYYISKKEIYMTSTVMLRAMPCTINITFLIISFYNYHETAAIELQKLQLYQILVIILCGIRP